VKNKIILLSLAVSGLLITAPNAYATTNQEVSKLSSTIADLVKLDANHQSLVEKAIDRALIVKEIQNNDSPIGKIKTPIRLPPRGRIPIPKKPNTTVKKDNEALEHTPKKEAPSEATTFEEGGSNIRRKYKVPAQVNTQRTSTIGDIR
jgi:hypothetical protein